MTIEGKTEKEYNKLKIIVGLIAKGRAIKNFNGFVQDV